MTQTILPDTDLDTAVDLDHDVACDNVKCNLAARWRMYVQDKVNPEWHAVGKGCDYHRAATEAMYEQRGLRHIPHKSAKVTGVRFEAL
jgi:hypothetical protein